ncbi:MAG: low molecular weight protein-tyrosine-phosphatase [Mariprofundaceae bacterium]|nr:low molecular weight protein-tyrosine-phosphatase [Mariprofundaceae bacterium]
MFHSILMVCIGNICRSPMADVLANTIYKEKQLNIASAGIAALVGNAAAPYTIELLEKEYPDIRQHKARQLTTELITDFELILVMEKENLHAVHSLFPQTRGRVHLLGKWNDNEEIVDPYKKSKAHFEATFSAVERGVRTWKKYL